MLPPPPEEDPVSTSVEPSPSENDVRDRRPAACWSVQGCDWRDDLPAEVTALLAPPVVVSAEVFAPRVPRPGGRSRRRLTNWTGGGWRSAPQVDPIPSRL
jgi:hypothetical protein